ncbi:hypothetical protein PVAND_000525 [Polypedilum vanderplanki]|uniref:Ionotropic receptor n=1 Tax=Polypedilum vanderplanki TaxID=319348 RepID=A0A9J6BKJ7_POLVA|nr:hypothetical protein PVAND_000525 [Polypedilum vanderplanki]
MIFCNEINCKSQKLNSVTKAILDIIYEFYIFKNINFDFLLYGESSSHINDLINEVTKHLNENAIPINLVNIIEIDKWNHKMNNSAVIFIKSKEMLTKLHHHVSIVKKHSADMQLRSLEPKLFKFLVYIEEIKSIEELRDAISKYNTALMVRPPNLKYFEFFITVDEFTVNLTANVVFTEKQCGIFEQKLLNSFDKSSQKWNKKLENFDLFKNFHGCLFTFIVEYARSFYVENHREIYHLLQTDSEKFQTVIQDKNLKFGGFTSEILEIMSKKKNFSYHCTLLNTRGGDKIIFYGTKNYKTLGLNSAVLGFGPIERSRSHYHYSLPFGHSDYYYLVTPNDLYTNYEKLIFPFDFTSWMIILLIFGISFVIILCLHFCPKWIKNRIIGKDVKNPGFNTLGIFFGISQVKLPSETLSRLILFIFICFCLIIRTCYQSMMFEFMTSDMRRPLPVSIEDLRKMNYTIVVQHGYVENSNNVIISGRKSPKVLNVSFADFKIYYKKALNDETNEKFAFLVDSDFHAYLNTTFCQSLTKMENEKLTKMTSYFMFVNNILLHELNDIINRLVPTGIAQHLSDFGLWSLFRPIAEEFRDPRRILSLNDLEFGFVLWLIACLISLVCFIFEISYVKTKPLLKKLIGLIGFYRLLRIRLNVVH